MDLSPLWGILFVAGSLLLPPAAARPPIGGASTTADGFDIKEIPGRSELLRGATSMECEMPDDATHAGIDSIDAQPASPPEQRARPSTRHSVHASAMPGCSCTRKSVFAEPIHRKSPASGRDLRAPIRDHFASTPRPAANRDAQADEATCAAVGTASGIDLVLRLVTQQFGAPVAQLLDEYQAYRAGWQERD